MKPRILLYATPSQRRLIKALKLVLGASNYTDAIEQVAERLGRHDDEFRRAIKAALRAQGKD